LGKVLTIKGMMVYEHVNEIPAAVAEMSGYIKDVNKLLYLFNQLNV
jgi:hypothetical protein